MEETLGLGFADVLEYSARIGRKQIHDDSDYVPRDHVVVLPIEIFEQPVDERDALIFMILLKQQFVDFGRQNGEQLRCHLGDLERSHFVVGWAGDDEKIDYFGYSLGGEHREEGGVVGFEPFETDFFLEGLVDGQFALFEFLLQLCYLFFIYHENIYSNYCISYAQLSLCI